LVKVLASVNGFRDSLLGITGFKHSEKTGYYRIGGIIFQYFMQNGYNFNVRMHCQEGTAFYRGHTNSLPLRNSTEGEGKN
jgi:hypothetical protein